MRSPINSQRLRFVAPLILVGVFMLGGHCSEADGLRALAEAERKTELADEAMEVVAEVLQAGDSAHATIWLLLQELVQHRAWVEERTPPEVKLPLIIVTVEDAS